MPNYNKQCLPGLTPYTVKQGENIYQIVQQFRIPLEAIQAANPTVNLQELSAGDSVCLPMQQNFPSCSKGKFYFIQQGDSYYRLSQYFFIPLEQLLQANPNTNPNNLQIGQAICIPTDAAYPHCPSYSIPYQNVEKDRNLTTEQAEYLVRRALGLMNQPNVYVTYDRNINDQYLIHVYDIVDNHTATRGWYLVNPLNGEITNYI